MQISWWTLALQIVNFVVLVWLLQRFLYKPVQAVIEKRRQLSEQVLSDADKAKHEAEAQKKHYEAELAGLNAKRQAVIAEARRSIEAERAQMLDEARQESSRFSAKAREIAANERTETLKSLREEVADLAVDLAKTLLHDLARSIPNDAVMLRLKEEFARLPSSDQQRIREEISANGSKLSIVTARPLEPGEEQEWRTNIEGMLDLDVNIAFEQDPSQMAGAILRLPHTVLRVTWADQLDQAKALLLRGRDGAVS